jgi:hypothetical protein
MRAAVWQQRSQMCARHHVSWVIFEAYLRVCRRVLGQDVEDEDLAPLRAIVEHSKQFENVGTAHFRHSVRTL